MAKDDRLFAPFPIEMDEHPKIMCLSDAAFRAVFEATFYSRRMMSDGFLDERVVLKRWSQSVADELSSNDPERPSWVRVELGWQIYNFDRYHPVRAEIEAKRAEIAERRSAAGKRGNQKRWAPEEEPDESQNIANGSQSNRKAVANDRSESESESESLSSTKRDSAKRATRLSESWLPSSESVAKIRDECPTVDPKKEHASFVDYWIAQPGQKGVKANWDSTWRNWMRRKRDDNTRTGGRPAPITKADQNAAEFQRLYGDQNERARSIEAQ